MGFDWKVLDKAFGELDEAGYESLYEATKPQREADAAALAERVLGLAKKDGKYPPARLASVAREMLALFVKARHETRRIHDVSEIRRAKLEARVAALEKALAAKKSTTSEQLE